MKCLPKHTYVSGLKMFFLPPSACMLQVSRVLRSGPGLTRTNGAGATAQDNQLTFLIVFISSGIHAVGCSSAIYLSVGVNTSLPCRDRSVMALFSPKRTVQGRQSIQLGKKTSKLTSYKSVKAMIFVHISLARKEWVSYNDVSFIM